MTRYSKYSDSIDNAIRDHNGNDLSYIKNIDLNKKKRINHTEKIKIYNKIIISDYIPNYSDTYICEIGIGLDNLENLNIDVMLEIGGCEILKFNLFDYEFIFKVAKMRDGLLYIPISNNLFNENNPLSFCNALTYHSMILYLQKNNHDNIYIFIDWCQIIGIIDTNISDKHILQLSKNIYDYSIRSYFFYYADFGNHIKNYEICISSDYQIETDRVIPRDIYLNSLLYGHMGQHCVGRRLSLFAIDERIREYDEKPVHYTATNTKITKYNMKKAELVTSAYRKIINNLCCNNATDMIIDFLRPKAPIIRHKYSNKNIDLLRSAYIKMLSKIISIDLAKYMVDYLVLDINKFYGNKYAYYIDIKNNQRGYKLDIKLESDNEFIPDITIINNNMLRSTSGMTGLLYSV